MKTTSAATTPAGWMLDDSWSGESGDVAFNGEAQLDVPQRQSATRELGDIT